MPATKQRLIILYDGTWNDPQDRTNVYRLSRSIIDYDGDVHQRFFYDPGVGTSKLDRFRGGVFGAGLSDNLLQGYEWLARRYSEGDEIWVFGFSRGAYTARSLVGMLRKCGLLHIITPDLKIAAEHLYRDKAVHPNDEAAKQFRARFSREIKVHLVGVWDTVGALGVPGTFLSERGLYSWHDTELSKIVERSYQAMALDEHRAAYDSVPWTTKDGQKKPEHIDVEQRWFIGAHANVGGGYGEDPLSTIPLAWLQQKAIAAGLKLHPDAVLPDAWQTAPRDSYKEFLGGVYGGFRKLIHPGDGRQYRSYNTNYKGEPAINITVDPSVWQRWQFDTAYRPPTLVRAGKSPTTE